METPPRTAPLAFAHRGARALAPENTVEAFVLACRLGATALESDVWLTADGEAVLDHDGFSTPRPRRTPIASTPRAALPPHIPTVADLYAACGPSVQVSLDVKDPAAFGPTVEAAERADGGAPANLWICDPDPERLAAWAASEPRPHYVASIKARRLQPRPGPVLDRLVEAGVEVVNMRWPTWTEGLVAACHEAGLRAFAWDVQSVRALRRVLGWGVDGIYSDHAHVLRRATSAPDPRRPR